MKEDRIILCMKWGTLYPAEYVNVLHSAVRRNLRGKFRFVCLTDQADGLVPEIEALPIPDVGLAARHWAAGAWPKVAMFANPLYDLRGLALFLDLDTVVVGELDPFFDLPGDIVTLNSAPWRYGPNAAPRAMSCFLRFRIGAHADMVEKLRKDRDFLVERYGNDQNYLLGEGPPLTYFPQDWVMSFKYHLRGPLLIDRLRPPRRPPPGVKLIAFHGRPRPIDLIRPPSGNWDVYPHYGRGRVDWMFDYWVENGGSP